MNCSAKAEAQTVRREQYIVELPGIPTPRINEYSPVLAVRSVFRRRDHRDILADCDGCPVLIASKTPYLWRLQPKRFCYFSRAPGDQQKNRDKQRCTEPGDHFHFLSSEPLRFKAQTASPRLRGVRRHIWPRTQPYSERASTNGEIVER